MPRFICQTCGVRYSDTPQPPDICVMCEDERQFVDHDGQHWKTLEALQSDYRARIEELEPGFFGLGTEPGFAIGQRALLWQSGAGNILWDCVPLLDELREAVLRLGGVGVIVLSHPHFQSTSVAWHEAFGARVLVHTDDARWTMEPHPGIEFWQGDQIEPVSGSTVIRTGGHFAGSAVCHIPSLANDAGAILAGDTIQVVADRRHVGFMRSYPNEIPLSAAAVGRIATSVQALRFDRLYGAWWERVITHEASAAVKESAARHLAALDGRYDHD